MKKWMAIFLTAAGLTAGARADSGWGLFGAYWGPGDWDGAGGVGAKIAIEIVPGAQLDLRGTWLNDFEKNEGGSRLEISTIPWETGLTLRSGWNPVDLYACGGIGFYQMDGDLILPGGIKQDAGVDDQVGYYVGLGGEVPLKVNPAFYGATRVMLFCEALYRSVAVDEVALGGGMSIDADMDGLAVNAGLMIRW